MGRASDGPPRSVVQRITGHDLGTYGAAYSDWLRGMIAIEKPDLIAYEAPLQATAAPRSAHTLLLLTGMAMLTETLATIKNVRAVKAHVGTWRAAVLPPVDRRRGADKKYAMLALCARCDIDVGRNVDRADAVGVWMWAHQTHGQRRAVEGMLRAAQLRELANDEQRGTG